MPFACQSARLTHLYEAAGRPGHHEIDAAWTRLRKAGAAALAEVPPLSEDSLRKYFGGHYDRNVTKVNEVERKFRAIEAVLRDFVEARPAARYQALDETLRQHRLTLSVLMNLYYGANPPAPPGCEVQDYTLAGPGGRSTPMVGHYLDGTPVLLLTPRDWIPARPVPLAELDAALVARHDAPEPAALDPGLAQAVVEHLGKRCDDDRSYRAVAIERVDGRLRMGFARSSYHRFFNGCEALTWDMARIYHERIRGTDAARGAGERLPDYAARLGVTAGRAGLRPRLQDWVRDSASPRTAIDPLDFANRSVGTGINTLLVLCSRRRPPGFLLHQRGKGASSPDAPIKLAEGGSTLHVVPAGTFQPVHGQWLLGPQEPDPEFSLSRNVLREFCEEALYCDDPQVRQRYRGWENMIRAVYLAQDPDKVFDQHPTLRATKDFFDQGRARQFFLGAALDLVSTKLEILTVLLLDWDEFEQRGLRITRENPEGLVQDLREFSPAGLAAALREELLQPAGAGCLALARRHFDALNAEIDGLLGPG